VAGDGSSEEIEPAVVTSAMEMAAAGVGTREGGEGETTYAGHTTHQFSASLARFVAPSSH
jgi:hypothetical protein